MSLESDQNSITTLLRAARVADDDLLKIVFRKILIDGISKEALNATDKSGRTAISYICSTDLTNYLDIMLQLPGIDVNKADNEGNTPLHFAAQAGQADALNMMLTRCRNLQIDTKNVLGFTPLMKAALQGRSRCAKLLLFAGASPVERDSGRKLNAIEWARFCGRESCAEMLEKCAKARQLEKSNSLRCANNSTSTNQMKFGVIRSKTNPIRSTPLKESFRSKFKKFLPFGGSSNTNKTNSNVQKDIKSKIKNNNKNRNISNTNTNINNNNNNNSLNNNSENKDLVNYITNNNFAYQTSNGNLKTKLFAQTPKSSVASTIISNRPLEVPKLEVTPANNQQLIKKYEEKYKREKFITSTSSPPNGITSSPRMSIRS